MNDAPAIGHEVFPGVFVSHAKKPLFASKSPDSAASSKVAQGNTVRSGTVINVITVDSPSLQKDQMADDDEPASKERRSSESRADNQYERFPLDVVVKIKKDGKSFAERRYLKIGKQDVASVKTKSLRLLVYSSKQLLLGHIQLCICVSGILCVSELLLSLWRLHRVS